MRARGSGGRLVARRFGLRTSLAGRMLAGGVVFTALLIAGVSGFLLVSRSQQTNAGAQSNADNRAGVAGQLIARVVQPQAQYAATNTAQLTSMQLALSGTTPATLVADEFTQKRVVDVPGLAVVIFDTHGNVLYTNECDTTTAGVVTHPTTAVCEQGSEPHVVSALPSTTRRAPGGRDRSVPASSHRDRRELRSSAALCPSGVEGVEMLSGGLPALDVAVPVFNVQAGTYAPLGVVVYSAPLQAEFARFGPVIGYTPVFLSAGGGDTVIRFTGSADTPHVATTPSSIAQQLSAHTPTSSTVAARAIYNVAGVGAVAGSFVPLQSPGGTKIAGYIGVEVPVALFAASTAQDEGTIAQIAFTALVVVCVLVLLFVDRFVRRPVARLERGVEKIAAGDYTTDIPVTSRDELGRLAIGVNSMRRADRRVYRAHRRVRRASAGRVAGVDDDHRRHRAAAGRCARRGGRDRRRIGERHHVYEARDRDPAHAKPWTRDARHGRRAVGGRALRRAQRPARRRRAVPPSRYRCSTRKRSLACCSSHPIVPLRRATSARSSRSPTTPLSRSRIPGRSSRNARRCDVFSELNQLKSDFLDTAQHELRTPVLAIQGQIELLNVAWDKWDEATRLDIVRDIDISVKLLGETVENVVDFALVNSDTIDVRMAPVDVAGRDPRRRQRRAPSLQGCAPGRAGHRRARRAGRQRGSVPSPSGPPCVDRQRSEVHARGRPRQGDRASRKGHGRMPHRGHRRRHRHQRRGDPATVRPLLPGGQQPHAPPRRYGHGPGARAAALRRAHRDGEGAQR